MDRVLLPGVTVLERLVAGVREKADERLCATVARQVERADAALRRELSRLLVAPGARTSELERLRQLGEIPDLPDGGGVNAEGV
ncbi:hypothetical protein AB0392_21130 [Nonomuraea angiospora]|uniref:hypothetical protein n=1 Tax=Nonomuraea angiospora TaxID=46172 RepID=UPI00344BBC19